MIRLPEHIALVLIHTAKSSPGDKFSIFRDDIGELLSNRHNIESPTDLIDEALDPLVEINGCKVLVSPLTGKYCTIDANNSEYYFGNYPSFSDFRGDEDLEGAEQYDDQRQEIRQKYPVLDTYFQADSVWVNRVIEALSELDIAQQFYLDAPDPQPSEPANVAKLDPDSRIVREIREGLEELEVELKTSNEAGEIFGDDKNVALAEVAALRTLVDSENVRPATAKEYAKRVLGWIAEKAGGAAIGELAKRLLSMIFGLFS